MIIAIDVGNTNIKIGVFKGEELFKSWRVATDPMKTSDELGMVILDLLQNEKVEVNKITSIIVSSVAPSMNYTIEHMCNYYFQKKPIMVSSDINLGIEIGYKNPNELGADRIATAVAAYYIYGGPVIIIDFGSATTFGVVDKDGKFLGGAIAPGIKTSVESLVNATAKLPRIELIRPDSIIGKGTVENMQSGIIYGFRGLVEYMIKGIKEEMNLDDVKIVGTGGLGELVNFEDAPVRITDRALSLKGLRIIESLNR